MILTREWGLTKKRNVQEMSPEHSKRKMWRWEFRKGDLKEHPVRSEENQIRVVSWNKKEVVSLRRNCRVFSNTMDRSHKMKPKYFPLANKCRNDWRLRKEKAWWGSGGKKSDLVGTKRNERRFGNVNLSNCFWVILSLFIYMLPMVC